MLADPYFWRDELDGWARQYGERIVLMSAGRVMAIKTAGGIYWREASIKEGIFIRSAKAKRK